MAVTPAEVTADTSIAARFRDLVAHAPDVIALVAGDARYSYAEIDRWSDAIARDLVDAAVPARCAVAILTRDSSLLVATSLAAVKAGHYFVVLDTADTDERIATILGLAGAGLCLADDSRRQGSLPLPVIEIRPTPPSRAEPVQRAPHDLVQLVFTSGTTGSPKGVATRQRLFVDRVVQASAITGRAAGARVSLTALPGFARATFEIFGTLLNGGTLCAFDARTERLDLLAELIERERLSILTLTPALFRRFIATLPPGADLSSVQRLRIGADVMTLGDVEAWRAHFPRHCTLERGFNATETGMVMHMTLQHDTPLPGPLVPIGRPVDGVEVWLLGEDGSEVPDGQPGEIVIHSAHVVHGYWNDPLLTAQMFTHDGDAGKWTFRSGDLAKRDAAGLYYFLGRKDSRLKIHGRRIDPHEVEAVLVAHANVREAAVVGKQDAAGELHLVAYVVMKDGFACAPTAIRQALRERLPAWMIPSRFHALETLPMTRSAKVDRAALSARVESEPEPRFETGGDAIELRVRDVWARVLGRNVGLHDDFFDDLGGESVVAAHLVTEIHTLFAIAMPLSLLLELSSVAKMADYLRARPDAERTLVLVQRGSTPPLFCVGGGGGSVIIFRDLATRLGREQTVYGLTHHGFRNEAFPRSMVAVAACYVDAIRSVQPEGPYFLAGYSAGGWIAYEIARQLTQAGEPVSFVGLIDAPATREKRPAWKRALKYVELIRRDPAERTIRYTRAVGRRFSRVVIWLRGGGWRFPSPAPLQVIESNRLLRRLLDRPVTTYPGRVTLFRAKYGWGANGVSPDLGWSALCGAVDVVEVDSDHFSVVRNDTHVLAGRFANSLAAAQASVTSPETVPFA